VSVFRSVQMRAFERMWGGRLEAAATDGCLEVDGRGVDR
jgi:hypothetical protein